MSFTLDRGKTLGIVGESGSGKTILSRSIMGLLPSRNVERAGRVVFEGQDIGDLAPPADARDLGHRDGDGLPGPDDVAEPGHEDRRARSPSRSRTTSTCRRRTRRATAERAAEVGRHPRARAGASTSTRTSCRAACASASRSPSPSRAAPRCCSPTSPPPRSTSRCRPRSSTCSQSQQHDRNMAMILVTHDLGVVAGRTDEIAVMYAGQIVEKAPTRSLFAQREACPTPRRCSSRSRSSRTRSHTRLEVIAGRPPDLDQPAAGLPVRAPLPVRAGALPRGGAAAASRPRRPGTRSACWYPVGTPEGAEALARNRARGRARGAEVDAAAPSVGRPDWPAAAPPTSARRRPAPAGRGPRRRVPRRPHRPAGARGVGHQLRRPRGRDPRPRRRVRLRQVHDRPGDHAAAPARPAAASASTASSSPRSKGDDAAPAAHRSMQMIFQDPISSLNPRRKVQRHRRRAARDLEAWAPTTTARSKVREVLEAVGIDPDGRRRPPAAPVLRRPVPAHLHRPGRSCSTRS